MRFLHEKGWLLIFRWVDTGRVLDKQYVGYGFRVGFKSYQDMKGFVIKVPLNWIVLWRLWQTYVEVDDPTRVRWIEKGWMA